MKTTRLIGWLAVLLAPVGNAQERDAAPDLSDFTTGLVLPPDFAARVMKINAQADEEAKRALEEFAKKGAPMKDVSPATAALYLDGLRHGGRTPGVELEELTATLRALAPKPIGSVSDRHLSY